MEEPTGDDEPETFGLEPGEEENVRADLEDLARHAAGLPRPRA